MQEALMNKQLFISATAKLALFHKRWRLKKSLLCSKERKASQRTTRYQGRIKYINKITSNGTGKQMARVLKNYFEEVCTAQCTHTLLSQPLLLGLHLLLPAG